MSIFQFSKILCLNFSVDKKAFYFPVLSKTSYIHDPSSRFTA